MSDQTRHDPIHSLPETTIESVNQILPYQAAKNMATTKAAAQYYTPHPPDPNPPQDPQYYVLLPYRPRRRPCRHLKRDLLCSISLLLFLAALFFLWPSDPRINIVRIQLNHVHPHLSPSVSLDVSMALTVKVRNRDFFSFYYDSIVVSIGYRGRQLGSVISNGGLMRARASSYVNATFVMDGIQVIHDAFYLIEDLAKGTIPFDTVTEVRGTLGLLFFNIPIKTKVSCEVHVSTSNQTITHQDCYPEFLDQSLVTKVESMSDSENKSESASAPEFRSNILIG